MAHEHQVEETKILLAGGGTGGHIYMGKAIVEALRKKRKLSVLFVGTQRGLEDRVLDKEDVIMESVNIKGLKGRGLGGLLQALFLVPRSLWQSSGILRRFQPQLAIGLGGYSSGPVLLQASRAGIATLIIEPNVYPGATNRWLKRWVDTVVVAFQETAQYFGEKCCVTGVPVREEFFAVTAYQRDPSRFRLLVFGGSQGSRRINRSMTEALPFLKHVWSVDSLDLEILHQTGQADHEWVQECYCRHGITADVRTFIDDMPRELGNANLVVSRSGGGTVGELCAAGRAAILIPFSRATDQHQLRNAQVLEQVGGARLLEEDEISGSLLADTIIELAARPDLRANMESAARLCAHPQAAHQIADLACELLDQSSTKVTRRLK